MRDAMMHGTHLLGVYRPIDAPSRDQVVTAMIRAALADPLRKPLWHDDGDGWSVPSDDEIPLRAEESIIELPPGFAGLSTAAVYQWWRGRRDPRVPLQFFRGERVFLVALDHRLADGASIDALRSIPFTSPEAPVATGRHFASDPFRAAVLATYLRHPLTAIAFLRRRPRSALQVFARAIKGQPSPAALAPTTDETMPGHVFRTMPTAPMREFLNWTKSNDLASVVALGWLSRLAFAEQGIDFERTITTINLRRYLPSEADVDGNFICAPPIEIGDAADLRAATDRFREGLALGIPLAWYVRSEQYFLQSGGASGGADPRTLVVNNRPQSRFTTRLPWVADGPPVSNEFLYSIGGGALALDAIRETDGLHFVAKLDPARYDHSAVERALDAMTTDPMRLLTDPRQSA